VKGDCRKWQSEELHDLYCSPNCVWVVKSSADEMAGACDTQGWFW